MLKISDFERSLEELPLLPAVVVRFLAMNPSNENYFDQVLELSREDPTFALRIIKLSNSAGSSPVSPISTLQVAVVRLGVKAIAGLVFSMAVMRVFLPTTQGEKNLWVHSIQVAVGSKVIAQIAPSLKIDPEQAYLCGLLHDIGRFVLFDKVASEMNLVEERNWEAPEQLIDAELEQYGFNHAELGCRVCKKWNLPKIVTTVVANHHKKNFSKQPFKNSQSDNLIHIIQMADHFSMFMLSNSDVLSWMPTKLEKEWNNWYAQHSNSKSPMSVSQLQALALKVMEESNKMTYGLGIRVN